LVSARRAHGRASPLTPRSLGLVMPSFVVGSSSRTDFLINQNGYVGIGTSSPFATLSIFASASSSASTLFAIGSTTNTGGQMSTTTHFLITNTGAIGVGTTSPWGLLSVNANVLPAGAPDSLSSALQVRLTLSSRQSGSVGIGTTTLIVPGSVDRLFAISGATNPGISIQNSTNGTMFHQYVDSNESAYKIENRNGSDILGLANTGEVTVRNGNFVVGATTATGLPSGQSSNRYVDIESSHNPGLLLRTSNGATRQWLNYVRDDLSWAIDDATAGIDRLVLDSTGRVGLGTSTLFARFAFDNAPSSTNPVLFYISSSTNVAGTLSTSTLFEITNTGSVGIGTSTPYAARLSVDTSGLGIGMPSFVIGSTTKTDFTVTQNGGVGVATSTPWAKLSVEMGNIFPASFVISNQGSSTPAFIVGNVNNMGRVGIGTSSPFATFSIVTATNGSSISPAFYVATTSTNSAGQYPLFTIQATTTGALDYSRVAIGTSSSWGNAGIRDQFFVSGRINSSWSYMACEFPGSHAAASSTIFATATSTCGAGFAFFNATSTNNSLVYQNDAYPLYMRLGAGVSGGVLANDQGAILRTMNNFAQHPQAP
jgi:hypothetical protein